MRIFDKARQVAGSFTGDRSGNFAMLTGVIASMLMLSVGLGVNVAQSYQLKSSLQNALDAAVTSTARDLTTGAIEPEEARKMVEAFLGVNSDAKFATTEQFVLEKLVIDKTARTIEATASANVNLAFPFFSTKDPRVSISSAAVYSDKTIEVAMMLDVTGSMAPNQWSDKIGDLRDAAEDAVKRLLDGQNQDNPRVRVAIVPYSDAVNAGALAEYVHYETQFTKKDPPAYTGVHAVALSDRHDNCATERKGTHQFTAVGPNVAMVNRDSRLQFCPKAELHPLTADADALIDTIGKFEPAGHTAGHIGIQWTRYLLSDSWADYLPEGSRPEPRDEKKVAKIAILMTDGEFNTAFANVAKDATVTNQPAKSRSKAERLCDAMKKSDKIEIFTIGFMLNQMSAKQVLKNCSSPDTSSVQHYYEAADGEALDAAFDAIIKNIERLALTK
ncbi:MAG TPA: pilus assembly protein [Pseudaminobacter sp.]|nr:pilus assembly protein [Pseudaminobacter sp.]